MSRAIVLLLLASIVPPLPASAQVRRCTAADGTEVYTDRRCEDIGASARASRPAGEVGNLLGSRWRATCPRSVQDLSWAVDDAIRAGDANRLAGLYDWSGMSTGNAYRLMDRLQAIAQRPLVDVQPVYAGGANAHGDAPVQFDELTGEVLPSDPLPPRLVGLRVEQTLAGGATPSRTVFGLRQRMGCWWVHL